ncbi:carcinoembryonic antigen-related cell adhesion molecule 6-like [Antechinus flavipes]|uniref:carcinoembryonic antigen-related cell adhesion molecule 6-like n=1 Tax=Antechinus flavipes TaxID=38775 RepID=UPI0022356ED1|nr:carcinoembryonic antigen-related cell adhesion molecule 6-like [Antechinus flavipes]
MDLSSHPSGSWKALLLTASFLNIWSQPGDTRLTIYSSTPIATVGQDVLLSVQGLQNKSQLFSWFEGLKQQNLILSYNVSSKSKKTGPGYTKREEIYSNASLLIKKVKMSDTRNYTFQELGPDFFMATASKQIQVYKMVSKPVITANTTSVTEARDSVVFQCFTRDVDITILWYLNNLPLPLSKTLSLSTNNKTLTLQQTGRKDAGLYQCEVWNQVSAQSSDHITLTVNYGPEQVKITQDPGSVEVHSIQVSANSTLTLSCHANSFPPAQYDWLFNNSVLLRNKDKLTLQGSSLVPGHYTCTAWNSLTKQGHSSFVYIKTLMEPSVTLLSGLSFSLLIVIILVGIFIVVALLCVLAYFLRKKAHRYSQEVVGGPGQKEKKLPSVRYCDFATYENGQQLQHQTSYEQMVIPTQDVDPYCTSPNLIEDPYQKLTFATMNIYEQIGPKEATQD